MAFKLSFNKKLLLLTSSIVVFCALILMGLTLKQYAKLYQDNARSDLEALSFNSAQELVQHMARLPVDDLGATTLLLKFERYKNIKLAQVYDNEHNLTSQYVNTELFLSPEVQPKQYTKQEMIPGTTATKGELVSVTNIGEGVYPLGHLVLVLDYNSVINAGVDAFLFEILPWVIGLLLILLWLTRWAQTAFISPLLKLSTLVNTVSETKDYNLRYQVKGDDEIAQLGYNLNNMLHTINQQNIQRAQRDKVLKKQQQSLEFMANYDGLTELPNRKLFQELLSQELAHNVRNNTELAVLFIDLDDFKTVNDSLGHPVGDLLLQQTAVRLRAQLRDIDILARFGGDEFVIVVSNLEQQIEAIVIADRILQSFKQSFKLQHWEFNSGLSIGIAFSDRNKVSISELLANADLAMYRAKNTGRGNYAVFESSMQNNQHRRLIIVNQLSYALANDEFELHYQPKVSPIHGVIGFEALLRWRSSFEGMVSPAEFIPIAEHCGKINDITRWVINQGFKELNTINKKLHKDMVTSFNVSAFDISNKDCIQYIEEALKQSKLDPSSINFEVTESAYIENFDKASTFFNKLIALGCDISLDDFGTGYSSLSYLTQVPASTLKIDQQFIRNMFQSEQERLIVDSIISLAQNLGLQVCAEGVETKEAFEYLASKGCQQIQGYYFAKPVPLCELPAIVNEINTKIEQINAPDALKSP
ncbi:EAL domain-containing protein [Psychrobium sp. 1_MG-2023]|uniref:EAL domain-containing protein n=1 Tax=Psychrobium sp. 1_MG-2023 TaxID=3062624 RepID=UPI0026B52798|nr:EAL domain-containing protein [Psychrobium sp. 1_MG-2023]MDP2562824.1 EAL domain-containing protein [Psychrobium sp. 1_MG-2023]